MSYVTNGRDLLRYAAQLEGSIHFDVPVSLKGADLYIVFGEEAFSNPLLLEASDFGSSVNELLGLGARAEKEYWLQLIHAIEWKESVELAAVASRNPSDWLVHCLEKGGLNHIMWCLAHKRDVVSQLYWAFDMVGVRCEDLNGKFLDSVPTVKGAIYGSKEGMGVGREHDGWSNPNRRQRYFPYTWRWNLKFKEYPLHRRGRQPRGKSLSDKRKGNLSRRYIKEYNSCL